MHQLCRGIALLITCKLNLHRPPPPQVSADVYKNLISKNLGDIDEIIAAPLLLSIGLATVW
jgi:hypothetical protein